MASGDYKEMSEPLQMILFGNESVEATFRDGCKIQMAACGTAFVHDQPNGEERHSLHGMTRTTHRTQFATSSYQLKVMKILAFKNRYSSRPYLCASLPSQNQATTMYENIRYAKWPLSVADRRYEVVTSNGTTSLTSLDGHASLTLAAHGKTFSVRYLAMMSEGGHASRSDSADPDDSTDCESRSTCSSTRSAVKRQYTRVSLHHSVEDCPACWQHPLQLLLQYRSQEETNNNNNNTTSSSSPNKTPIHDILERKLKKFNLSETVGEDSFVEEEEGHKSVLTSLPASLDLNCPGKQLHKWRQVQTGTGSEDLDHCYMYSRVKVVYMPSAVLRVVYSHPRHMEIYPTDGSVMVSRGTETGYYDHYIPGDDQIEDRTYSVKCPPPDTGSFPYSVKQLIQKAQRILQCVNIMVGAPEEPICWQATPTITPPTNARNLIVEDTTIEGVANFQATRNGRVRILFVDRTRVDLRFDYELATRARREGGLEFEVEHILPDYCRLMSPNAEYEQVSLHHNGRYDRYTEVVKDWIAWVVAPKRERPETFSINARQMERQASIKKELKKIECFNYILDNVVLNAVDDVHEDDASYDVTPTRRWRGGSDGEGSRDHQVIGEEALSPAVVADILRRNKMAIREIEQFTRHQEL